MSENKAKISIVIPAYNEEENIGACLAAIKRETAQSREAVEIIVVDNAGTDRTAAIASSFPGVKVVREERKGLVRARQAGYKASSGVLIANIDADTIMPAGWLKRVLTEFERDDRLLALSGPFVYYDLPAWMNLWIKIYYLGGFILYHLTRFFFRRGAMLQGGNFIVRRSALEKIGGYDTRIEFYGEDTDVARRLNEIGKTKFSFRLPILTSGRRLKAEGIFRMAIRYGLNYFWTIIFKKPFTKYYRDIRRMDDRKQ